MYGRLNPNMFGWRDEQGERIPFVLSAIYRYAGMYSGIAPDGRICARPIVDFDALSLDEIVWYPAHELGVLVPMEGANVFEPQLFVSEPEPGSVV